MNTNAFKYSQDNIGVGEKMMTTDENAIIGIAGEDIEPGTTISWGKDGKLYSIETLNKMKKEDLDENHNK